MNMNLKITPPTRQQQDQFTGYCQHLGLKQLAAYYLQMIDQAHKQDMGYFDFLENILQLESAGKQERHIQYLIKYSRLPTPLKLLADFDFDFQPGLNRKLIADLASLRFLERNESILFIGNNGTGKSHLAQSLALNACQNGYKTFYTTCSDLINDLNLGAYEKSLDKRMKKYTLPQLLVIDEMGHDRLELQMVQEAHLLFKVIDQRYKDNKSLIFTSNIEEPDWHEFLGDPVSTSAILDRIFHHSVIVRIKGPSYRKHQGQHLQNQYGTDQTDSLTDG